jgi:hypothetical protein
MDTRRVLVRIPGVRVPQRKEAIAVSKSRNPDRRVAPPAGFAIHDPEVDWMHRAYSAPRCSCFVVERDDRALGGGRVASRRLSR